MQLFVFLFFLGQRYRMIMPFSKIKKGLRSEKYVNMQERYYVLSVKEALCDNNYSNKTVIVECYSIDILYFLSSMF